MESVGGGRAIPRRRHEAAPMHELGTSRPILADEASTHVPVSGTFAKSTMLTLLQVEGAAGRQVGARHARIPLKNPAQAAVRAAFRCGWQRGHGSSHPVLPIVRNSCTATAAASTAAAFTAAATTAAG